MKEGESTEIENRYAFIFVFFCNLNYAYALFFIFSFVSSSCFYSCSLYIDLICFVCIDHEMKKLNKTNPRKSKQTLTNQNIQHI